MEIIKAFKNWIDQNRELTRVVDGKVKVHKVISAETAYTIAKYNQVRDQSELVSSFMNSTMSLIEWKYNNNEYCCQREIPEDIIELAPKIVDYFRNKLGYKVIYVDDKTTIHNDGFGPDLASEVPKDSAFISIFWKDIKMKSLLDEKHPTLEDVITQG